VPFLEEIRVFDQAVTRCNFSCCANRFISLEVDLDGLVNQGIPFFVPGRVLTVKIGSHTVD
jgi:hypothetical protein